METENLIHQAISDLLGKLGYTINKIKIDFDNRTNSYKVNFETQDISLLIGHRGEGINALQHLIRLIIWRNNRDFESDVIIDIDNYRKRQEENILKITERKVEQARKSLTPQSLPAMSPYFRRIVHLHLTQDKFHDISTESQGNGEKRFVVIKPQLSI